MLEDHHLFVCTGSTCTQQGAEALLHRLRQRLEEKCVKNVRLTLVRCLGQCGNGPNMVLYGKYNPPEGVWYGDLTEKAIDHLVSRRLIQRERLSNPAHMPVTAS